MQTLSIKQPWAHLVISGAKNVENRTWKTDYRGSLLVHACGVDYWFPDLPDLPPRFQSRAQTCFDSPDDESEYPPDVRAYCQLQDYCCSRLGCTVDVDDLTPYTRGKPAPMPAGYIVGRVALLDCVRGYDSPWAAPYQWQWVLGSPEWFSMPIGPIKGQLGLWDYTGLID